MMKPYLAAAFGLTLATSAFADAPPVTIGYQPMIATGLAANAPFEAWFALDKSWDPQVTGYALPAGATIRFTFPAPFKPGHKLPLDAVLIRWAQGAVPAKFKVVQDGHDPHVIDIHFDEAVSAGEPGKPGMKAIHLRTPLINPTAGDYPVTIQFLEAGAITGHTQTLAHVTPGPQPNIAPYNQLHAGQDEDWQHVRRGEEAAIPIDFLITLPGHERSSLSVKSSNSGTLTIFRDETSIGSIRATGAQITLTPHPFGPGYARLGIVELHAKAGTQSGLATIEAKLDGGTRCAISLVVE